MTRFWLLALAAAFGATLASSCVPEFAFGDDTPQGSGGAGGSGGEVEAGECAADGDCGADRRCDLTTQSCVRCLPENDNCPKNFYCTEGLRCAEGCKNSEECQLDLGSPIFTCEASPGDSEIKICVGCTADTDCPAGKVCGETTECIEGCHDAGNCEDGYECCPGASAGELGSCVLTVVEPLNCGACGNVCDLPENAKEATCRGGMCGFECETSYADCDGMPENGCEVLTLDDEANCGTCDQPCAGTCVDGVCQ